MRERLGPGTRVVLVGGAVLALLAVVALASRGGLGSSSGGGPAPSGGLLDYAFSVFLVAYVLTIPFALWAFWIQRKTVAATRQKPTGRRLQNVVVFLVFVLAALALVNLRHSRGNSQQVRVPTGVPTPSVAKQPKTPREPEFQWSVVVATAVLALAGVGGILYLRRRRGGLRGPVALSEQLTLALDDAIADVESERDPRRAVIKAYARMEAVLAAHGLPRRPSEAPYEYLARALQELEASGASVGRLTDLFERAKFSLHEIDTVMRSDAIAALTTVRDELRVEA